MLRDHIDITRRLGVKRALALASLLFMGMESFGQEASSPVEAQPPGVELKQRYVDGSFAFGVSVPESCVAYREKRALSTGEMELVRFVDKDSNWSLSVRQVKVERPIALDNVVDAVESELSLTCKEVEIVRQEPITMADREGFRCAATAMLEKTSMLHQRALVRYRPTDYFVLTFLAPARDRPTVEVLFDRMIASFEVLRSEVQEERIRKALRTGISLLKAVEFGERRFTLDEPDERFFRYVLDGKDSGFLQIRQEVTSLRKRPGLMVGKWLWLFKPDDSVTHISRLMFVADDLSYEEWQINTLTVLPPAKDGKERRLVENFESATRFDDQLLINYRYQPLVPQVNEKALEVEASFAPAPWDVLLPRLVDLAKTELYAFSGYDAARKGLALQTFEVVGPRTVTVRGVKRAAFLIEQSEGLIPPKYELYVDEAGGLLLAVVRQADSLLEMELVTREEIDRDYGPRIREVEKLLPKPPPPPQGQSPDVGPRPPIPGPPKGR